MPCQGTTTTTVSGTAQFSHLDSDCNWLGDCDHGRNYDGAVAYNPAPTITHPDLASVVYLANPTGTQSLTGSSASADTRSAGNGASANSGNAGAAISAAIGSTRSAAQGGPAAGSDVQGSSAGLQAVAAQTDGLGRASIGTVVHPGSVVAAAAAAPRLAAPVVQRVSASGSGERARDVILTVVPRLSLPTSSLFTIHTAPGAKYLVETDPRFTNGQTFLSSDYFLAQLNLDPERTLTRYGDGFEEQQLINDQVLTLTGRRYLSGYTNTQDEYSALMNAGAAFAKQYQLTPGVALSAELMALLTTDIVWLTTQTVTLPDGSTRQVLVPELYIRRPQATVQRTKL